MKLEIQRLTKAILGMEEKEPEDNGGFHQIMGIVSGSRACLEKTSLGDLLFLLENLDEILCRELRSDYPAIKLEQTPGYSKRMRRAI